MPTNKDIIKTIGQFTKTQSAAKKLGKIFKLSAQPGRQASGLQIKKIVKALEKTATDNKMALKKQGLSSYGLRQVLTKKLTQDNRPTAPDAKPSLKSATDFLAKVRQGIPGSKESAPIVEAPKVRPQHVPLADNFANIEAITNRAKGDEPVAPDIG